MLPTVAIRGADLRTPYGPSPARVPPPVASSYSESCRTSRIARERPWPSTGSSYPRVAVQNDSVSVRLLAPRLLAAEPGVRALPPSHRRGPGRNGPQSREGLEEGLRPGTPGPPCRLPGRLAQHVGGRVVRSEERRNWTGRTNFGRAEQSPAETRGFLDARVRGAGLRWES